ncbi:hypothetical protein GF312_08420 [Candidatus Poribacteria bacterium]|nr:hypothetical protein [Candidatus Poribacteria bacterium]
MKISSEIPPEWECLHQAFEDYYLLARVAGLECEIVWLRPQLKKGGRGGHAQTIILKQIIPDHFSITYKITEIDILNIIDTPRTGYHYLGKNITWRYYDYLNKGYIIE